MDRHRRESKDTGSSRDHRRSRSPLQPRNSEGGYRSRRSRSFDKNKSSKDSGDASRKRSDDDIRHKESSKDKYDDARGRNNDYNEKRKFSESNRSRGRDGEASSGGKSSSSHNREDDRERDKAFMKKDTANREDAVVIRNSSCSSSSSFKRSRRSSSPPSSTIRDVVGEKSQIVRETSKRSTRPTESSRDPGRTGDDSDNSQSESQKGSHRDDHSSTACIESDIKTSEVRDVDDHGREVRSRRESSISKASRYGDDYSRRDDSSRGRTDTGRAEGHRRSDTREGGTREKTDRHRSTHKDFSPERGERRLRDAVEGTSRKDQGPLRHQYGPGGQDNDFSTGSGQGGNGNGNGGSREVPGPHGGGVDMWGTGKGTNMSEGGFGQNGGMAPFAGWEGQGSQQGGGGGRERAPTSESFRDDWHRGHQHHSNFPAGPNGFMGGQTGGRFDQFALQPSSEFDKRQWGWDQQQQQQSAGNSSQEAITSSSSYQPAPGLSRSSGSNRQAGKPSSTADTERGTGERGGGGGGSSFKPPPPPPPPKLSVAKDLSQDSRRSMSGDSEGKRRSMSDSSADNRDALRENKITSKFNEGSGQTKVRSDSTCSVGSGVPPVKKEEEEEEVVKLRWALEDSSVPVSRRLAGCELYDRVLALRGILSLRTDSTPLSDAEERPAATPSESERKENSNATLDEILASLVQPAGVTGGSGGDESLDERAAVNVDDFFGSFTGAALDSAAWDVPKGESQGEDMDRDIDLDSEASAGGDMYGDLKGDDNGDGDDMYGDLGGDDDDDAVDEDDEEENKAVSDSVTHTAAPSTSTETAPSVTTDFKVGPADCSKGGAFQAKRDYSAPPPGAVEDIPYALQDMSYSRMNLFSKALKGQGFSTFLLQSLPDLKKLFRKETCIRKAY